MSIKKIPLVECFGPTIQGEGAHIGQQTYFLRFGLCDYACDMCDSMYAVDPAEVKKNAQWLTQTEILDYFLKMRKENSTQWITFSGGNPCIHNLSDLCYMLSELGYKIAVETQGTKLPEWLKRVNSITVAPKGPGMGEDFKIEELYAFIRKYTVNLKFVVFDQRDVDFAAEVINQCIPAVSYDRIFLSLGNPAIPDKEGKSYIDPIEHQQMLLKQYRALFEDIQTHPILSKVKFLPQWHIFAFGNERGV